MITVTIKGFKTLQEAEAWVTAYEQGVEQDMATWSAAMNVEKDIRHPSGYNFPFAMDELRKVEENNITITLTHPDTYEDEV